MSSRFVVFAVTFFLWLGGAFLGLAFTIFWAPGGGIPYFAGFFMFPLSFMLGMTFWQGLGIMAELIRWIFRVKTPRPKDLEGEEIPSGSIGMLFAPFFICPPMGVIVYLFGPDTLTFWKTIGAYTAAGLGYGLVCYIAARNGVIAIMSFEGESY